MTTEKVLLAISALTGVGLLAWTIKQGPVAASIPTQSGGQQNFPFPAYTEPSPVNTAAQFSPYVSPRNAPPQPVDSASVGPTYLTFNFPSDSDLMLPAANGDPAPLNSISNLLRGGVPDVEKHDDCGCGGSCSCLSSQSSMSTGTSGLLKKLLAQYPDLPKKYSNNVRSTGLRLANPNATLLVTDQL